MHIYYHINSMTLFLILDTTAVNKEDTVVSRKEELKGNLNVKVSDYLYT